MKRTNFAALIACVLSWAGCGHTKPPSARGGAINASSQVQRAFENRLSDVQVEGEGQVVRVLADDLVGGRHQRFILRLASGQTLLVAHNIDIAPRVAGLRKDDIVRFYGEYVWSAKGGTIHWTHRDPNGRHVAGWLRHAGKTYQ